MIAKTYAQDGPSPFYQGGFPSQASAVSAPFTSTKTASPTPATSNATSTASQVNMKKWLWILALVFAAAAAFGQTTNTLYARNFPGSTVGAKVTNAQDACSADTAIPCIIVIDPVLAAYPSGTMPSKCANCIWWDYRTINGGLQVNSVVSGQGLNCNPTIGNVVCALNAILPNGEEGITQAAGDSSQRLATDAFVANQVSAVSVSSYGEAHDIAAADDNTITLGSAALPGTVALWQDDQLVPPSDYSVDGKTISLNGYVFATGANIDVYWGASVGNPGGATISDSGNSSPQVRQAISAQVNATGPIAYPIPPDAQIGDLVMIFIVGQPTSLNFATVPTGWSEPTGACGFFAIEKIMTQSDIEAGSVTVNSNGDVAYTSIDFAGPTGGIREAGCATLNGNLSGSYATSSSDQVGDGLIAWSGVGYGGATSVSGTESLGSGSGYPGFAASYTPITTAGSQTINWTVPTDGWSEEQYVVVESGSVDPLNVEPANYVFAGPPSGAAALPAWRALTPADLPAANDISTTPDTATPSTFPAIQSISGAGCTTGANSYDSCDVTLTWPKPFADATYQVSCTADTPSVTQTGCTGTSGCQMGNVAGTTKTATTVTVIWETTGANAATATNFNCIAMQNTGQ